MIYFSIAITIGGGLWLLSQPTLRHDRDLRGDLSVDGAAPDAARPQRLEDARPAGSLLHGSPRLPRGATATCRRMLPEQIPSPWYRGRPAAPSDQPSSPGPCCSTTSPTSFVSMVAARGGRRPHAGTLVALLPRPLADRQRPPEHALADILIRLGEYDTAAHYAADSYRRSPSPIVCLRRRPHAAALGDRDTALGWLPAAEDPGLTGLDRSSLATGPAACPPRRRWRSPASSVPARCEYQLSPQLLRRDQAVRRSDQLVDLTPVDRRRHQIHRDPTAPARYGAGLNRGRRAAPAARRDRPSRSSCRHDRGRRRS